MKNQKTSAALLSYTFTAPRYNQAAYNRKGALVGVNLGTTTRPRIVPVNSTGTESVEQFLARGGVITVGRATKVIRQIIRVKPFRNVPTNCQPARSR